MRKITLLALTFISVQFASSQNFAWVQGWGSDSWDHCNSVATDPDGNILVAGNFRSTMDADPGPAVKNLVPAGGRDIFVSKYNASGKLLWARQMSGPAEETANGITTDAEGNVYITGIFQQTVDFNPGPFVSSLTAISNVDAYICKLDSDGELVWVRAFSGGGTTPVAIAVDEDQNVYTTGRFNALTDFDPGSGVYTFEADLYPDMFVSKLDDNGHFVWAKRIAENGDTAAIKSFSIAIDQQGNVITTGIFNGTVDFDPGPGEFNMVSLEEGTEVSFPRTVFVSKLDADGNFVWAASVGQDAEIESNDVAVDEDDNIYIAGYFLGTADFDPGPGTFNMVSNAMGANSYVCKLDPLGGFVWSKAFSGSSAVLAESIMINENDIYTTGYFNGSIDFDPGAGFSFLNAVGGMDIFVNKLDLDGNHVWAQKAGGTGDEEGFGIAVDPVTESVFVTGYFTGTTDFDSSIEDWEVASRGEMDIFLLKLSTCTPIQGVTQVEETCNQYLWPENNGLYTASGTYWNIFESSEGCDSIVKLDLDLWHYENQISMNLFGELVANPTAFIDEYKWVRCDTYAVVGTQGSYHVTATGNYALISTSGNCVDTSNCFYAQPLGIEELGSAGFLLYPNPASDQLTFQSQNALQPVEIEVTSVNGQLIYAGKHTSGDQLSLEKWQTGIYLVKIISGDNWYMTRVVKD